MVGADSSTAWNMGDWVSEPRMVQADSSSGMPPRCDLDFAADGSGGAGVFVFVGGVGPPVDGDLAVYAEVEEEQGRGDGEDFFGGRGGAVGVAYGDAGVGAVAVG